MGANSQWFSGAATDTGLLRTSNEDRYGIDDLHGMACVLTLAVVDQNDLVIGHVGDSRLYLIWNGAIRKLTSDHSPVGEGEDAGVLSEEQAMLHPRRNEVFRNVGTRPHGARDEGFIE